MGNILLLRSGTGPLGNLPSGVLNGRALGQGTGVGSLVSAGSFAPNQPSGLTVLIDRQWNPTDSSISGGVLPPSPLTGIDSFNMAWQVGDGGNTSPLINTAANLSTATGITVSAPPDGHSTFMAIVYPSGQAAGTSPFAVTYHGTLSTQQLYHCCYIFIPTGFANSGNNIKWNGIESGGSANHIFMLVSGEGSPDYRANWLSLQGGAGNAELGGAGQASTPTPITSLGNPPPQGTGPGWWAANEGAWHLCEWYAKQESNPGVSGDGIFKSWFDGTLINSWNNLNFNATSGNPNAFNITNVIPYYGGGGSAQPGPGSQYFFVGRWYVAVQ